MILFDEIEKAHSDVFNIFLQILDEGRLTDGQGKTVDFRNTLVLMTSNIGSKFIEEAGLEAALHESKGHAREVWERQYEKVQDTVRQELRNHFRPEFLNRVDDIVLFRNLNLEQIQEIVDVQMQSLQKRLAERNISIVLNDKVKEVLAQKGYDPAFGARPFKRALQKHIQDPLSLKILQGEFSEGDRVKVDVNGNSDTFTFEKVTA